LLSRNAIPLAATALHAQDACQRLPVNHDRDEVVAGRDRSGAGTEPPKAATSANWCTTKCLSHEPQRAKTSTTATTSTTSTITVVTNKPARYLRLNVGTQLTGASGTLVYGGF